MLRKIQESLLQGHSPEQQARVGSSCFQIHIGGTSWGREKFRFRRKRGIPNRVCPEADFARLELVSGSGKDFRLCTLIFLKVDPLRGVQGAQGRTRRKDRTTREK